MKKKCETCGANMMEYRHVFNKSMADALIKLWNVGHPINIKHLGMTMYQWNNFQKIQYWGLVEKFIDENGDRKGGVWKITQKGIDFIKEQISIPKSVWTYRGVTVRHSDEKLNINNIIDTTFRHKLDYVSDATLHS